MASLGFSDVLSLVQSIVLVGALAVTLYFSRQQVRAQRKDLETATLASLDEKIHNITEILAEDPSLLKLVADPAKIPNLPNGADTKFTRAEPAAYYILSVCAHAYHMKEKGVLKGTDWEGYLIWMRNIFRYGTLDFYWKGDGMEYWFDSAFREYVNREILVRPKY